MSIFHVLIGNAGKADDFECLFRDLSKDDLESKFLSPYRAGKNIFHAGTVVNINRLAKIKIIETERDSEAELTDLQERSRREIDEINRESSVVFIGFGRGYDPSDLQELGQDVTSNFIHGAPGYDSQPTTSISPPSSVVPPSNSLWQNVVNHPWFVAVIGGLIVAVIAFVIGLV